MVVKFVSEDLMTGNVTYELGDGRRVQFDRRALREYGLAEMLRAAGLGNDVPKGRIDVMQSGKKIGSVPAAFEPMAIKSTSPWYEPRGGDFVRDGEHWVANRTLCPGDLDAVPGFVWDRQEN